MSDTPTFPPQCPLPTGGDTVQLDHGGGGLRSQQLLDELILPRFANPALNAGLDSALLDLGDARVAFTTDAYVVNPLVFPGGDIGKLAICGTVNDLLMTAARPAFMSCSLIIEEGLKLSTLAAILDSMADAASRAGVSIVTGDTKVVERGRGDGLYINTAGIGCRQWPGAVAPHRIRPGDQVILSSDIGRHGLAVMAQREGLQFEPPLVSDCASLLEPVTTLLDAGIDVHCMRDATRGGLATVLVELAESSGLCITIDETAIPIGDAVMGGCEVLGLDPLYIANEGCFIALVSPEQSSRALNLLHSCSLTGEARVIGEVREGEAKALLHTRVGSTRALRRMTGQLLPRIC